MSGAMEPVKMSAATRRVMEALAETIIPSEDPDRPGALEMKLADRLMAFVSQFPGGRSLLIFVCWMWEFSPLQVGTFQRFSSLSLAERTLVLEDFEKSALSLRRLALLGLKAVLMASFYNNPAVWPYIGYQEGCLSPPPPAPPSS